MARKSVDDKLRVYMQQMGKVPDLVIAKEAEVSRAVVVSFRQRNGIPAYDGHRHRVEADTEPERSELPPTRVPSVSVSEAPVAFLAVEPPSAPVASRDSQSDSGGVTEVSSDGKPTGGRMEDAPNFKGRRSALDVYQHLLGQIPDARLAEMANVTPENVRSYRTRRGISADWNREEESAVPESAPLEPVTMEVMPQAFRVAFQVKIDLGMRPTATHLYVVLGYDIVDAVQTAVSGVRQRHPKAEVRAVERVAELLEGELS
jgi:hypothetical protein